MQEVRHIIIQDHLHDLMTQGVDIFNKFPKSGVPKPVTGSQPSVAFEEAYGTIGLPFNPHSKR